MMNYEAPPVEPYQKQQSSGFAVTALVLGIVSFFIPVFGTVTGILAIIFGSLRLRRGSAGHGMAVAGFTLGLIALVGWGLWLIILAANSGTGN